MKIKEIINLVYIDDDRDEAISSYLEDSYRNDKYEVRYQEVEFEITQADIQKFKIYVESLCRKEIAKTIKEIISIVKTTSFMIIT